MTTGSSVEAAPLSGASAVVASLVAASAGAASVVGSTVCWLTIAPVPCRGSPERHEAEDEDPEGPDGQVPEVVVGDDAVLHENAAGDRENVVDRLPVGEGLEGGVDLLDHGLELEEDTRGVEDHAGDERGDLGQVTEVD